MDCFEGLQDIPKESVDLIILDPPYFKVVAQSWDYEWRTIHDYQGWMNKLLAVLASLLRIGGTMYLFGYFRSLAPLMMYFDLFGLDLRQQIIIDKGMRSVSGRATKKYKVFPNTTECVLMLIKDNRKWFREYVQNRRFILKTMGVTSRMINEALGVKSNGGGMWSIYTGNNVCSQFPTKEHYDVIREKFLLDLPEYEKVAQTFHPQIGVTDVWSDINFSYKGRSHPTEKPVKLAERIILASSNEGDTILDPMCGSGNFLLTCQNLSRHFIGFEKDEKYYQSACSKLK